jgi:hypothetical protein
MFYITFHSETNIWAYDHKANRKTKSLLATPSCAPPLKELRGMTFGPNGYLYVVNAHQPYSQVLVYSGSGDSDNAYDFIGIYADSTVSPGVDHPFTVAFDSSNNGYISNQDTNVVTAVSSPGTGSACDSTPTPPVYTKATALAVASYLTSLGTFLPGTFVASSYGALPGVSSPPPTVPQPQGLDVDPANGQPKVLHSVRDVLIIGDLLYVADEPGDSVKTYALVTNQSQGITQGQLQGQITDSHLKGPVHMLLNGGTLYISSSDRILACDLATGKVSTFLSGLSSPAGMAFDSSGNFFFADRTGQIIWESAYDSKSGRYGKPTVFIPKYDKKHAPDGLEDQPEFLVYVNS